jgi:SAM-dependent methyltransferase
MNDKDRMSIPDDCLFYHTIALPGYGTIEGAWDHRDNLDAYLGHTDFSGKQVLDVGPANGFFSFEIEKRGAAKVTALDLGENADWDAVPHYGLKAEALKTNLRNNVRLCENAFRFSHKVLKSQVHLAHGSVYDTPKLVDAVDIALMGNILQHLRDPFRAIEQVAKVVRDRIIITESIWMDDPTFLNSLSMNLVPRANAPLVDHSWWHVSPALVIEILKILGFHDLKREYHDQRFNYTALDKESRIVRCYTITGSRFFNLDFLAGWHEEEFDIANVWRWSHSRKAQVSLPARSGQESLLDLSCTLLALVPCTLCLRLNGVLLSSFQAKEVPLDISLSGIELHSGENILEFESDIEPMQPRDGQDPRKLGFALFNVEARLLTQSDKTRPLGSGTG